MESMIIPFKFQDGPDRIMLKESCWINGSPYFTRKAIGEWLEYKKPQKAIDKLIERNPKLDDPRWSTTVNLTAVEGVREVVRELHVYDPIGFQMVVFESKQPKAMEYKYAVAKLVSAFMKGEIIAYTDHYQSACYKRNIAAKRFKEIDRLPYGEKQSAIDQLAQDIGISRASAHSWHTQHTHDGTLDDRRRIASHTRTVKEHGDRWKTIQDLLSRGLPVAEVAEKAGVCLNTVYRYINRYSKRYGNKITK